MKQQEWFKIKAYPHIGLPITARDKARVCSYIKNANKIASHSFLPFIHKMQITRKFRKEYDADTGDLANNGLRKFGGVKKRDLYYASHLDSNIYSYYAHVLNKKYEKILREERLNDVVTAYRKIPLILDGKSIRNKCNVDFANDVFTFIKNNSSKELAAITLDIEGFFDNMKHQKLKEAWCNLYNVSTLPNDHYNVFRNITKFSFIEQGRLFDLFKDRIIVKMKSGDIVKKKIPSIDYMRNQKAIAFCDRSDIHEIRRKGLIYSNKRHQSEFRDFGICQGSPISSVLANLYMLSFDKEISQFVKSLGGIYRRYSDDMVIVCPIEYKDECIELINIKIDELADLTLQHSKTKVYRFFVDNGDLICGKEFDEKLSDNSVNYNLEYLGFSFDGNVVSLKNSSLAKYHRKMKRSVRRSHFFSKTINNDSRGQIFKRRLYKKFSYIGARRALKYERIRGTTDQWRRTKKYNWGNFITYAKLASRVFDNNCIDSQIKSHWRILNNEIRKSSPNSSIKKKN